MASLLHLREQDLGADLAPKLAPFIRAYSPFQKLPTPVELREAGYEKIKEMSFLEECEEIYFETHGYYPEDKPEDPE